MTLPYGKHQRKRAWFPCFLTATEQLRLFLNAKLRAIHQADGGILRFLSAVMPFLSPERHRETDPAGLLCSGKSIYIILTDSTRRFFHAQNVANYGALCRCAQKSASKTECQDV